jgi:hypothetical protein
MNGSMFLLPCACTANDCPRGTVLRFDLDSNGARKYQALCNQRGSSPSLTLTNKIRSRRRR